MELPDTFIEVYDFYYVPFWQTRWFMISVFVMCCMVVCITSYFLYRWYKKRKCIQRPESPHEWAYIQLEPIQPNGEVSLIELSNYYLSLTYILKNYMQKKYGWKITHKTDQELMLFLDSSTLSSEHKKLLPMLLSRAQEIKFAPETVTELAADDWQQIHNFIVETSQEYVSKDQVANAE